MSILDKLFGTEDDTNDLNKKISNNKIDDSNEVRGEDAKAGTLELRKEELDINKNKVQTGEVTLSKDVIEEQQTVNVPVTHEEVVIERRTLNSQPTDSQISSSSSSSADSDSTWANDNSNTETIRIPLTEEHVEVDKHTVVTGEVTAYKRDVERTEKVEETVKREEARVNKTGDATIVNDSDYTSAPQSNDTDTIASDNNINFK